MIKYNFKTKVYYKDVDQMGIVYYSRYFEYFEQARTEMFSSVGLNVTKVEEEGIHLPVISSHCDYKKGARFENDLIMLVIGSSSFLNIGIHAHKFSASCLPEIVYFLSP